jgi:alpha-L-arabinofuranosidase
MNDAWGYWSTDGFGLHEFLQFCEDMGMEPLYGINCGLALGYNGSINNTVPLDQMGPWVQDALDLIQYANGDTNTTWGALRAANGHPAPFNLKYIEIGNENGGSYYNDRYSLFYDAIKSNYPNIHIIGCVWGGIPWSRPVEIQDEHYYSDPGTFISYATKYDSYSRRGPRVFVGEYAVTSGYGTLGNLAAALGEAAFMTGMERNSDIVRLASYAPLFANVNGIQWRPDLIYYDSSRVTGTPSYYVQKLFGQNRGDMVLPTAITITSSATNLPPHGAIGLGSWNTAVQYTNLVVSSNGVTLYQSDFVNNDTNGWRVFNGTWSASAGLYQQTAITTDCRSTTGNTNWASYTISLNARKLSGSEGFLILFNWLDDNNWTWWNIGGWNNTLDGVEQMANGTKTVLAQVNQTAIQTNQWYNIRIVLSGSRMQCYLNSNLVQDLTYPATASSGLFASSTYSKASGEVVIKAVNPYGSAMATTFNVSGVSSIGPSGTLIQLTSGSPSDENSLAAPNYVSPVTNAISNAGTNFTITLPANSLSVLRLKPAGIKTFTNLQLAVASPLTVGQTAAAVLWAWQTGQSNPINLATNSNHAVTWRSANAGIAAVDLNGNVTGVGPGTTTITATYDALGLSATQTVQVLGPSRGLVHRYSFDDLPGSTTAADSIGGAAWNGTLPNGGTFGGGQLALASSSNQYLLLRTGILSNYPAVTIEAWVTFWDQLPVNCFFFGFGNTISGSGQSYIFCAPQGGRIAITASDWSGEQNAYSDTDFSFHTNFHVTAVFDPPDGCVVLYTNGVLVGINTAVTVPMSSVNDLFCYVGRSLYNADPYPDFTLDEFRIYNGALSPAEIAATQALGPGQLLSFASPLLSVALAGTNLMFSWPVASAGFTLQSSSNLVPTSWSNVSSPPPQLIATQWQVMLPASGSAGYYRLMR